MASSFLFCLMFGFHILILLMYQPSAPYNLETIHQARGKEIKTGLHP
jgi:hypothetical protein